ncbi:hypothetical protein DM860_006046 [Cuscuta australis]|uniref:Uncharacterized protein n=1 Tax=Cuscuta australis TaxID=267555 RepID=A0A328DJB3_9ASTE|nr:hypothetical protein DM860_006046 [Cuscuta australis]
MNDYCALISIPVHVETSPRVLEANMQATIIAINIVMKFSLRNGLINKVQPGSVPKVESLKKALANREASSQIIKPKEEGMMTISEKPKAIPQITMWDLLALGLMIQLPSIK